MPLPTAHVCTGHKRASVEPEERTRTSACATWNRSHEDVASGVSVGLVHDPILFIVAVRARVSIGERAVSDELS